MEMRLRGRGRLKGELVDSFKGELDMTDQYVPNGTPLTDLEKEVLTILMEECGEVVIECGRVSVAASKLIRFGKENRPDENGQANTQVLGHEIGDLMCLFDRIAQLGLIYRG
jgi:hypothetical protein